MVRIIRAAAILGIVIATICAPIATRPASAAGARALESDARAALRDLYAKHGSAKLLASKARAILVFPTMVKAGFMFGGQIGEGVRFEQGKVRGFYNSVAASYGLQAGLQSFGYALFFMNKQATDQLDDTRGFELGVGPSVVIVDQGIGKSLTTNTMTSDTYAFIFDQKGLMAGVGIQGSKITRIDK